MKKNELHKIEIVSYSSEGDGIGRIDGMATFVKNAIVGEQLEVKILKVDKNLAWAKITKILKASPKRINPDCNNATKCGGCKLRHMKYEEELRFKLQRVNDAFERIGKLNFTVDKIHGANEILRYRNKATFPVGQDKFGNVNIGIFQHRSHNIIDTNECLIQSTEAETVIAVVRSWMIKYNIPAYDENNKSGLIRHIFVRTNYQYEVLICIISTMKNIPKIDKLIEMIQATKLNCVGIIQSIQDKNTNVILGDTYKVIDGSDHIIDKICGLKFQLSVPSFFQVNRCQAEVLYKLALNFADIKSTDTVLDLYCGTGTITLCMAKNSKRAIGVEIMHQAIKDAVANAKLNNLCSLEFICANASAIANKFANENFKPDVICVDPPRKGLEIETINSIFEMQPEKIIYISCNPATLARDLYEFSQNNYKIAKAECVDMFPRTAHIETVCLLTK